jgi:hypothetical protein
VERGIEHAGKSVTALLWQFPDIIPLSSRMHATRTALHVAAGVGDSLPAGEVAPSLPPQQ